MSKKKYYGLSAEFVPYDVGNVLTASPVSCIVISVQYYVGQADWSQCNTDIGDGDGEGYSFNWNRWPY